MGGFGDLFGGLGELFGGVAEGGVELGAEAAFLASESGAEGDAEVGYTRYLVGGPRELNVNDI